jgi:hypothetical protein
LSVVSLLTVHCRQVKNICFIFSISYFPPFFPFLPAEAAAQAGMKERSKENLAKTNASPLCGNARISIEVIVQTACSCFLLLLYKFLVRLA